MAFNDKAILCRNCGEEFMFTAGEQGFYLEMGLMNEPRSCPNCRASRRHVRPGGNTREMHPAVCAQCGAETTVPFLPKHNRPVFCGECFEQVRLASTAP